MSATAPTLSRSPGSSGSPETSGTHAILTPLADGLLGGGLSIAIVLGFVILRFGVGMDIGLALAAAPAFLLSAAVNWPHFMASYRLLYASADNVRRFKAASIYVPVGLIALYGIAYLTQGQGVEIGALGGKLRLSELMVLVATLYLAWHYTGQAWGMVASFAYTAGVRIEPSERLLIRSGCRVLLVWHFVYVFGQEVGALATPQIQQWIILAMQLVTLAAAISLFVGLYGFWRLRARIDVPLPVRVVMPWVALYAWYLFVAISGDPVSAWIWVQLFHALQYLSFPFRVEMNRYDRKADGSRSGRIEHAALYFLLLMCAGLIAFWVPGETGIDRFHVLLITSILQIHHYFVDGAIWKISNPETRRDLFAHLQPASSRAE